MVSSDMDMKKTYRYDPHKAGNDDEVTLVKWCRRNFGERGVGWDFTFVGKRVTIDIWYSKFQTMWEICKE